MKKINIVKENKDFESIINTKKNYANGYFSIYLKENNKKVYRFGITIPKKVGNAVVRNKIKRQIKDIIDNSKLNFNKNTDYVIIIKKKILDISYLESKQQLYKLLTDILKKEEKNEK